MSELIKDVTFSQRDEICTGKVSLEFLSNFGRYISHLYEDKECPEKALVNKAKFYPFTIERAELNEAHIKLVEQFNGRINKISGQIIKKLKSYLKKNYLIHKISETELINCFKVNEIFLDEKHIGLSCESYHDLEHGLGIVIKGAVITVGDCDHSYSFYPANDPCEFKLSEKDQKRIKKYEALKEEWRALMKVKENKSKYKGLTKEIRLQNQKGFNLGWGQRESKKQFKLLFSKYFDVKFIEVFGSHLEPQQKKANERTREKPVYPPILEKYILETEEKLALKFPESYRKKMMFENGGRFKFRATHWTLYPFWDKSDRKSSSKTFNDIERETQKARELFSFPEDAIAIGHGGSGKLIFRIDKKDKSKLLDSAYWWDIATGKVHLLASDWDTLF